MFLKIRQNSQENTCARVSFLIKLKAVPEILTRLFSCEFCRISKRNFFTEHFRTTAFRIRIHIGYIKQPQSISEILYAVFKLTYGHTDLLDFM